MKTSPCRVSIIIVNWNGIRHLGTCLDSLASQTFRDFEVILVDNGSTDDSVPFVAKHHPWVRLVELGENTGFATGNNRGLEHAQGDYIVTLNNDTRAEPDWLERLVEVADAHPRAGMVGSRICSFDDPDLIDSIGVRVCQDAMSRGWLRNRRWSALSLREVEQVLIPSACVALYRRTMIEKTGFFDDEFFAYCEDTDLGLRGRVAGWDALIATGAVVYHRYSQTGGTFSPLKIYLVERNHYWVALKTFPTCALALLPFSTFLRYFEQLRCVMSATGSGGEFRCSEARGDLVKALLGGMRDAFLGTPRMLRKRRQIMKGRKITSRQMKELLQGHTLSFRELLDR